MIRSRFLLAGLCAIALGGCSTLSFGPPEVEAQRRNVTAGTGDCGTLGPGRSEAIGKDVDGALYLVDNFIFAYRCAKDEVANGRQVFEVPSFLSIVTAAIGPSFGLGRNWRLGTATAGGVFAQANSYYAPKEKVKILDSALDALLCVKTQAAGAGYFDTRTPAANAQTANDMEAIERLERTIGQLQSAADDMEQQIRNDRSSLSAAIAAKDSAMTAQLEAGISGRTQQSVEMRNLARVLLIQRGMIESRLAQRQQSAGLLAVDDGGSIAIDPQRKYFEMVSAAAFSIERVLATRLSEAGTFDPAGIAAQFKEIAEAQAMAAKDVMNAENGGVDDDQPESVMKALGAFSYKSDEAKTADVVSLKLDLLQTKLQDCVVRAKIS